MAVLRDHPYTGANFLVSLGDTDGRDRAAGFAEVVFPTFVRQRTASRPAAGRDVASPDGPDRPHLVLRRGVIGSLDLYRWWEETRRKRKPPTRTVTVELLAEDHATTVLTWRFLGAYPVSLGYSPLSAVEGGILFETVELAFDDVEMA